MKDGLGYVSACVCAGAVVGVLGIVLGLELLCPRNGEHLVDGGSISR